MEVAFQAKLKSNNDGEVVLDEEWFNKRIEDCQYLYHLPRAWLAFQRSPNANIIPSQGRPQAATT
jgi:hypothetical protein